MGWLNTAFWVRMLNSSFFSCPVRVQAAQDLALIHQYFISKMFMPRWKCVVSMMWNTFLYNLHLWQDSLLQIQQVCLSLTTAFPKNCGPCPHASPRTNQSTFPQKFALQKQWVNRAYRAWMKIIRQPFRNPGITIPFVLAMKSPLSTVLRIVSSWYQ